MAMHTMLINKPPDAGTDPAGASPQHHLAARKAHYTPVFRNESQFNSLANWDANVSTPSPCCREEDVSPPDAPGPALLPVPAR